MYRVGYVVRLVAQPGKEEDLAAFLRDAEPLAHEETYTPVWLAYRAGHDTFYITDMFADASDREQHLTGPIAAALREHGPGLLAARPEIVPVDVLVAKLPESSKTAG